MDNQFPSRQFAAYGLIILLSLVIVFHVLVLTGIIPYDIVWGGRLESHSQMIVFEFASIAINLLMIAVSAGAIGLIPLKINRRVIKVALWIMTLLFLLNTVGNFLSLNDLEKLIFTPMTLVLGLLSLFLAVRS